METEEEHPSHGKPARRGVAAQLITRDNQAWIFRVGIIAAITSLWLYSDRHNDDRYVRLESYVRDQDAARRTAADTAVTVGQLQAIRQQDHDLLTEMKNDIKWIRENQNK